MASWKDGLKDREGTVTQLACVIMSSRNPPYSAEVLEEARKTARKFEVGFVSRSKSAKEYASKVAAKKGDLIKKILNGKIPEGVQKENYQEAIATAAMLDKAAAKAEAEAKIEVKPEVKPEVKVEEKVEVKTETAPMDVDPPPQPAPPQAPVIQRQPSDTAAAMAQAEKEPLIKTILRRVLERHEIKYHLSTLELDDAKKKYSAKAASAVSHAMKKYHEQLEARNAKLPPAQRKPGLGEAVLIDHITNGAHKMLVAKLKEAQEPKQEPPPPPIPKPGDASFVPAARPPGMEGKNFEELVGYWKRLGELRVAYLPRVRQTLPLLQKYARGAGPVAVNAGNFARMTEQTLIPLLSQTADEPMMSAKFTADELAALEGHVKKLVALAGGRGVNEVPAPAPVAPKPAPVDESAGDNKRKRDGEEGDEEDGEDGERKRARTEPEPEPKPVPRVPSAFTGLTSCAPERVDAQPAPPMPASLDGKSTKKPSGKSGGDGVGCPVAVEDGGSVTAVLYSSDDVGYWAPGGDLLRRALEGEPWGGKSAALFKSFDELREIYGASA